MRLCTSDKVEWIPRVVSIPASWRNRSERPTNTAAATTTRTTKHPFTIGPSSRSSALLRRVTTAAASDNATSAAMGGRTIPANQSPVTQ